MPPHDEGPRSVATDARAEVDAGQADQGHHTPSHVETTEAALLGAMILSTDARAGAVPMVTADDFVREAHRIIFQTVAAMHANGEHVDQITVNDRLCTSGKIDHVGGLPAVWALTSLEGCPVTASWPCYATVVAREGKRRRVLRQLNDAVRRLEAGEDPAVVHLGTEDAA